MKLSPLIKKLQKLEQKLGNIDICISFNGCHNSGELLEISEIRKEEFFINDETGLEKKNRKKSSNVSK